MSAAGTKLELHATDHTKQSLERAMSQNGRFDQWCGSSTAANKSGGTHSSHPGNSKVQLIDTQNKQCGTNASYLPLPPMDTVREVESPKREERREEKGGNKRVRGPASSLFGNTLLRHLCRAATPALKSFEAAVEAADDAVDCWPSPSLDT